MSDALKTLRREVYACKLARSPLPEHAVPKPKPYTDNTANGLTRCIVDYLNLHERCFAFRVNSVGIWDGKKWRTSGAKKGIGDIAAIIRGKSVWIEVKIGSDRMRDAQKRFRDRCEEADGAYLVARSFDDFLNQYNALP